MLQVLPPTPWSQAAFQSNFRGIPARWKPRPSELSWERTFDLTYFRAKSRIIKRRLIVLSHEIAHRKSMRIGCAGSSRKWYGSCDMADTSFKIIFILVWYHLLWRAGQPNCTGRILAKDRPFNIEAFAYYYYINKFIQWNLKIIFFVD